MARQTPPIKKTRAHYFDAFREEALALADRIGVAAAQERGLQLGQLSTEVRATIRVSRDQGMSLRHITHVLS